MPPAGLDCWDHDCRVLAGTISREGRGGASETSFRDRLRKSLSGEHVAGTL